MCQNFILGLDNIPLNVYTTYFLSIHLLMDVCILVMVNNVAINIGMYVSVCSSLCFQFFCIYYLGVKFLDHMVCLVSKSCPTLWWPMDCSLPGSSVHDFPGKNTGVSCHFLLQGIFQTQGSNPHLLLSRWILNHWATWEVQILWQLHF